MTSVTILADNTVATPAPKGLRGEWGFAALVDDVLFDTGQTGVALHNAALLDCSLDVEAVVLSHAHYDHTNGLRPLLNRVEDPTIYCHPGIWVPRYADPERYGWPRPIGVPYTRAEVTADAQVVEHTDPVEVADGIVALGEIPRTFDDAAVGKVRTDGPGEGDRLATDALEDDPVPDDQALAVDTGDGTAVILGCGHAGLRNTIEHAEAVMDEPVRYVLGGTHLVALEAAEVHAVADWLDGRLDVFAGTHCTGFEASAILRERLPEAFTPVGVGTQLDLPPTGE